MIPAPEDTVEAPAFGDAPSRRRPIHAESAVQKGAKRFARRAVACEHEFVSHDREKEDQPGSHIWAKERGARAAWPDTELACDHNLTANVEMKKPGWKPPREGTLAWPHYRDQRDLMVSLHQKGRIVGFATSVTELGEIWERGGVPLHPNWRTVAAHEDELVAADIRKQIARRDGAVPAGKPFRGNKHRNIRRLEKVRSGVMF